MPRISPERLAAVRRLYEKTSMSVADIALVAGVSDHTIYRRAKEAEWRRRSDATGGAEQGAAPEQDHLGPAGRRAGSVDRAEFARRLWIALDRQLRDLEGAGAVEGDARAGQTLSTLTRTLEKLIEVERDLKQERETSDGSAGEPSDVDVGALLAELAGRIEALA